MATSKNYTIKREGPGRYTVTTRKALYTLTKGERSGIWSLILKGETLKVGDTKGAVLQWVDFNAEQEGI